jgi:hypothetical protein
LSGNFAEAFEREKNSVKQEMQALSSKTDYPRSKSPYIFGTFSVPETRFPVSMAGPLNFFSVVVNLENFGDEGKRNLS